jgi:hypothetical protein
MFTKQRNKKLTALSKSDKIGLQIDIKTGSRGGKNVDAENIKTNLK